MENILKPKGMMCNIRKMIEWIIVCNRVKDDCNLLYMFSSFISSCFCFCLCDTLGIQGFLRFSGELVSFVELGQPDLIKVL